MTLAAGCHGLTFWQYRSERIGDESNGWGMREMDGSPTRRSSRCDRMAQELRKWGGALARSKPVPAPVAILFNRDNDLLARIKKMSTPLFRLDSVDGDCDYEYKHQLFGSHYLWRRCGHSCDMVTETDDCHAYRLLCVGGCEMVSDATAALLRRFVEDGGTLLVEYPFACRDGRSWMALKRPSCGLDNLLGCKEIQRLNLGKGETLGITYDNGVEELVGGTRVVFQPAATATVAGVWEDGAPAVVVNHVGRGHVIACGGSVAVVAGQSLSWRSPVPELYRRAVALAGLKLGDGDLWTAERRSLAERFLFWFSVQAEPLSRQLPERFSVLYHSDEVAVGGRRLTFAQYGTAVLAAPMREGG